MKTAPRSPPLRAAVVGCGALAHGAHLPNLRRSERCRLEIVCDRDAGRARAAATAFGAPRWTTDWRALLDDPAVDVCFLCTHLNLREEFIVAALHAGKPVYTEKPMADTDEALRAILGAAARTGVPLCVGHNRRSSPAVRVFRRLLEKARARGADRPAIVDRAGGAPRGLREETESQLLIRVNDDARSWKAWVFDDPGGILLDEMTHFVDLALWLMPAPPDRVYADGSPRGNFAVVLHFQDGSLATLHQSMVGHFDYPKELIEATARHVTLALDHHLEVRQCGLGDEPERQFFPLAAGGELTGEPGLAGYVEAARRLQELRAAGQPLPCPAAGPDKGHRDHLERFAQHLLGEGENPCPPASAVAATRVTLRALDALRAGHPVRILPEDCAPFAPATPDACSPAGRHDKLRGP